MARPTAYSGTGFGITPSSVEETKITRNTLTHASHRREISQRAPSAGSLMVNGLGCWKAGWQRGGGALLKAPNLSMVLGVGGCDNRPNTGGVARQAARRIARRREPADGRPFAARRAASERPTAPFARSRKAQAITETTFLGRLRRNKRAPTPISSNARLPGSGTTALYSPRTSVADNA